MRILAVWSTYPDGRRAAMLTHSTAAFRADSPQATLRVTKAPSLGEGWTRTLGEDWRSFDFIALMGDDVIVHPGYAHAAACCLADGFVPTPRMLGPNGELQRTAGGWGEECAPRMPACLLMLAFLTPELLECVLPLPPIVLGMDVWLKERLETHGHRIVYEPGCVLSHLVTASDGDSRPYDLGELDHALEVARS